VAVQDIEAKDQRNAQAAVFDRHALPGIQPLPVEDVEQAADAADADLALHLGFAVRRQAGVDHVELAELLVERHAREQLVDAIRQRTPLELGRRG
jgi:hypothetical protein